MRIVFFGTPEFAVPSLRAIVESQHELIGVVAQPDKPAGRHMQLQTPAVAALAKSLEIPLMQPPRVRDDAFLAALRDLDPDLCVVVAYGKILPRALLVMPRHGFINVHASLLPKYRGAAPIQRAIENGETTTGVTIMRVDEELDHGPMLQSAALEIGPDEHTPSLAARLAALGGETLVKSLDDIEAGTAREVEQDHAAATYAKKIEKEEGRLDWTTPARVLYNRFRAFDPWPGLFADFGGETIKLLDVRPWPLQRNVRPGELAAAGEEGVDIATSDGALRLIAVQRPGKKPVRAIEFARMKGLA